MEGEAAARIAGRPYVAAGTAVGSSAPGWRLTVFLPSEPALRAAARSAQVTALLGGLLLALAGLVMLRRRRWALARQAVLSAMNAELERRVAQRTEELNRSNAALAGEIAEREAAETRARRLRDELAQANRLSILGQVSAGVAHEINQPLAAIRAYAETGGRLLDAGAGRRRARQPARDRRRHRAHRRDHPGAARLRPARRRGDPAGGGRGGARRGADAARRTDPRRRRDDRALAARAGGVR